MYQGGSGGFLLFYYMLLSGEYTTGLDMENIDQYITKQYHPNLIDDKKSWKVNSEHWQRRAAPIIKNSGRMMGGLR